MTDIQFGDYIATDINSSGSGNYLTTPGNFRLLVHSVNTQEDDPESSIIVKLSVLCGEHAGKLFTAFFPKSARRAKRGIYRTVLFALATGVVTHDGLARMSAAKEAGEESPIDMDFNRAEGKNFCATVVTDTWAKQNRDRDAVTIEFKIFGSGDSAVHDWEKSSDHPASGTVDKPSVAASTTAASTTEESGQWDDI